MFGKASLNRRTWRSCNTCNTWGVFRVWLRVGGLRGLWSFLRQVGELCDVHWSVLVLGVAVGEGSVHQECTHPLGMACFWPSFFHFRAPNFGELRELGRLTMKSFLSSSWDFYSSLDCMGYRCTCYSDWIPKCYMKAPEKLLNNQIPLGARELCCLTFHPVSHLGKQRMCKVPSTVRPPASWAPNEAIVLVPLCWLLDGAPQLFRWLWGYVCVAGWWRG